MNYLIFFPEEIKQQQAEMIAARADQQIQLHGLKVGIEISAAVYGDKLCRARITDCRPGFLRAELDNFSAPPSKRELHVITGLCRPQTVKKVIAAAFSLGAKQLDFVRTENSEKSYLTSKIFSEQELKDEIILAMAQSGDSGLMPVRVFHRFKPFIDEELPKLLHDYNPSQLILAEGRGSAFDLRAESSILAIGPESGWNDFEREQFLNAGFKALNLGPRQLRIEQALLILGGKII